MSVDSPSRLTSWRNRIFAVVGSRVGAPRVGQAVPSAVARPNSRLWLLIRKLVSAFNIWLWVFVFLPTLCAGVFFFGIASDLYMSEADFVVKSQSPSSQNVLAMLIQTSGISRSSEDTFSVNGFILSRDAVRLLDTNNHLREVFNRPEADFITRFPNLFTNSSFEKLYKHYLYFVDVTYDSATGVTRLQVQAYRPEDAQMIARALLTYSEQLVNQLNARAVENTLDVARREVQLAEDNLEKIQEKRAALGRPPLVNRNQVVPGDNSSSSFSEIDRLTLERELGTRALASALASLETARVQASRQQLYIEHISEPNLPDYPLYPRRFLSFVLTVVTCLVVFGVAWLLVTGVREHGSA